MNKVLKYATGQEVPKGAIYLCTIKNGTMEKSADPRCPTDYFYVWHYFLVQDISVVKEKVE